MTTTTQPPGGAPRDVLIFVPGLGRSEVVQPAHVAELLSWELNQQAPDRATTFVTAPTSVGAEVVHRIERTDSDGAVTGVLDVYGYDSVTELDSTPTSTNPLLRVLSLALTVVAAVLVLFGVIVNWRRRAKSRAQLLQAFAVLLIVLCIVVYFAIAVYALVEAVATLLHGGTSEPARRVAAVGGAHRGGDRRTVPKLREKINWLGERSVQMARFTYTGALRNRLSGGLQHLIDRIAQRPEVDQIHLVGYSFGSMVALETVYPHGARPAASLSIVKSLVSIGSPFDLIRMVRPNYAEGATLLEEVKPRWINIYQPIDVLGSNFRDDTDAREAVMGVSSYTGEKRVPDENLPWNPDLQLTAANLLMLRSLSVHAGYWDQSPTARSALGLVVGELARQRALLG